MTTAAHTSNLNTAIATAFNVAEDKATELVDKFFGEDKTAIVEGIQATIETGKSTLKKKFVDQSDEAVTHYRNMNPESGVVEDTPRMMTLHTFFKRYTKGTYILLVRNQILTVKNGAVLNAEEDAIRMKGRIKNMFRVVSA